MPKLTIMRQIASQITVSQCRLVVMALAFLILVWQGLQLQQLMQPPVASRQHVATPDETLQAISQWHLFGQYQGGVGTELPLTTLPLTLQAVLFVQAAGSSQVIISAAGAPAKPYREGDRVMGAQIAKILQKYIILNNNGRQERLLLLELPLQFASQPTSSVLNQGE